MKPNLKHHSIPANALHFIAMTYKTYKIVFAFVLAQTIAGSIIPLMGLYLPRLAIQLVMENRGLAHAMLTLGTFAGVYVLLQCVTGVAEHGRYPFLNLMRNVYRGQMFFKALDCDYDIMETSEGQTRYHKAISALDRGDGSVTYVFINNVQRLISGAVSFVFLLGILTMLSPLIVAMLIVLSVLGFIIDGFPRRYEEKCRDDSAGISRKIQYVERVMSDVSAAKDMRIYNLSALVSSIKGGLFQTLHALNNKIQNRYFAAGTLNGLLTVTRDGVAYAFCIWHVIHGSIAVPDFVLFMGAIAAFSGWLKGIAYSINELKRANVDANDLRGFYDFSNRMDPENPTPIEALGREIDIEFRNVSFRYTDINVLENLSFTIRAKEKVALVGVNGAGKTTIVKLLCGFYKATAGEILLNGHNINDFKRADLYNLFSAVFQDICILPFSVAENITFQVPEDQNEQRILDCLKAAGLDDVITDIKAPMTKILDEDGIMLSGGQQQKLTIARALYKNAPFLILDEPTAALDPIAESEVYEKFHEVTRDKTAIYISHRLASTRFCDKILMLEGGRIVEDGSHDRLISQNGQYAKMFEIQSHYYKESVPAFVGDVPPRVPGDDVTIRV